MYRSAKSTVFYPKMAGYRKFAGFKGIVFAVVLPELFFHSDSMTRSSGDE
jgi:hypothetical protein